MGKYIFSFTILAIVMLYSVTVNCKHMNKSHHTSKNHSKHLHVGNKDKSVKRDHSKHHAHAYQPGLELNKNIPVILPKSNLDLNHAVAVESNKTQNETINETHDKNQKVLSEEKIIVHEIGDKSLNKDQENVAKGLSSLYESKSNSSLSLDTSSFNVQTVPLGNAALNVTKSNETALLEPGVFNVQPVPQVDTALNKFMIKESPIEESRNLDIQPIPQGINPVSKSTTNETAFIESRSFGIQPVPQINTALNEFTNNKTTYFDSRSLDVQPMQGNTALNVSMIKEFPLENSGVLNKQPLLQENTALGESMSNRTDRILTV